MTRNPAPALTTPEDLITAGLAAAPEGPLLRDIAETFRIRITGEMAAVSDPGVRQQFLPSAAELTVTEAELADPIGDHPHSPVKGLTHRYPDRVILHTTQTCEIYCRFCFRRETVGGAGHLTEAEIEAIAGYLEDHPAIWEVILTGGDPLVLSPRRLQALLTRLAAVPSVEVIRFHTRVPVVAPEKITKDLLAAMDIRPTIWLVLHTNHPAELTEAATAALLRLNRAGVPLLSQSVLLKGVNDDPETLEQLFRALIRHRVKPYYLHHPDLAKGTSHFRLPIRRGQEIMAALRGRISGTALPLYVLDIPGGYGKVPIGPSYLSETAPGTWQVTDPQGKTHLYRDQ